MLRLLLLTAALGAIQPPPTRILFIGNSLTYANDLPAMVCALARSAGRRAVCESLAKPDYGLEEHWNEGAAQRLIARGWDVVVLQQGPSALPESRRLLIQYVHRFDEEIRKAGGRTALYMVWPSRARRGDFPGVSQAYTAAAAAVKGLLLPAGDAWRAAWTADSALPLYGPDGFHPSPSGTYLAALVAYRQIFGEPPPALPVPEGVGVTASVLRRAAEEAIAALTTHRIHVMNRTGYGYSGPFIHGGAASPVGSHSSHLPRHGRRDRHHRDAGRRHLSLGGQ